MKNTKRKSRLRDFSFWLGCRAPRQSRGYSSTKRTRFVRRSALAAQCRHCKQTAFFQPRRAMRCALRRAGHPSQTNKKARRWRACLFGWGAGIRTPEMSESESDALPLGDTPIFGTYRIIAKETAFVNPFFQKKLRFEKKLRKNLAKRRYLWYNIAVVSVLYSQPSTRGTAG